METVETREVYLDYQSSKPVDPRVVEVMLPYFHERYGNPSSLHLVGDRNQISYQFSMKKGVDILLPEDQDEGVKFIRIDDVVFVLIDQRHKSIIFNAKNFSYFIGFVEFIGHKVNKMQMDLLRYLRRMADNAFHQGKM